MNIILSALRLLLLLALAGGAQAANAPKSDPVLLTIDGNISKFNRGSGKTFTITASEMARLSTHSIVTATDWTPRGAFRGPLLRDLLAKVGAQGSKAKFYGEDDYNVTIPLADFGKYDVILAYYWNGKPMTLENYGPLWVMYPIETMPAAEKSGVFLSKLIWQVNRIEVK